MASWPEAVAWISLTGTVAAWGGGAGLGGAGSGGGSVVGQGWGGRVRLLKQGRGWRGGGEQQLSLSLVQLENIQVFRQRPGILILSPWLMIQVTWAGHFSLWASVSSAKGGQGSLLHGGVLGFRTHVRKAPCFARRVSRCSVNGHCYSFPPQL